MPHLVHLIRHGQSTFNAIQDVTGKDPMMFDAPLTPLGHEQAAARGKQLAGNHYDLVITSPLTRAIQTAQGIFGGRKPLVIDPLHREWVNWSCNIGRPATELAADFPDLDFNHLEGSWWHVDGPVNENGIACEPHTSLLARVAAFQAMLASHREKRVAVVGHGDFFSQIVGYAMQNCECVEWKNPFA